MKNWNPPSKECAHDSTKCCSICNPSVFSPSNGEGRRYSEEALSNKILKAKKAYYAGKPFLRDEEFDALEGSLRAINPDAPVLNVVGSVRDDEEDENKSLTSEDE